MGGHGYDKFWRASDAIVIVGEGGGVGSNKRDRIWHGGTAKY